MKSRSYRHSGRTASIGCSCYRCNAEPSFLPGVKHCSVSLVAYVQPPVDVALGPEVEVFEVELVKDNVGLGITIAGYISDKPNGALYSSHTNVHCPRWLVGCLTSRFLAIEPVASILQPITGCSAQPRGR